MSIEQEWGELKQIIKETTEGIYKRKPIPEQTNTGSLRKR